MITVPQWRRSGWRLLSMMTPCQQRVIDREKMLLLNVRQLLDPLLEPSTSDLSTISSSIRHLDELFCITVIGEFNSGKSTFVNALLGQRVCDEGVTPTTSAVATIRYDRNASPTHTSASSLDSTALVCVTAPWLKDAVIVDTPGTNAIVTGHQQITEEIIPRSDLVFFITSIDRPFSESERLFMSKIHEWKRKIVVVINKIDMLDHISRKSDLDKVVQFVRANTQQLLQLTPPIFTVSGKAELFARLNGKNDANSGFSELQKFINQTLSDVEKMQLKLENPLAVVERLLDKYVGALEKKIAHVKMEKDVIDKAYLELERLVAQTRTGFGLHCSRIDNVLLRLLDRIDDFLMETLRLSNIQALLQPASLARLFESDVACEFGAEIDRLATEASEWLSDQNYGNARRIASFLEESHAITARSPTGTILDSASIGMNLARERSVLNAELRSETAIALQKYNRSQVSLELSQSVKLALTTSFFIQLSGLGLGAALASAASLDISGLMGAGSLAVGGLLVLPYKKRELTRAMRSQVISVQRQLHTILQQHLDLELKRGIDLIHAGVDPYGAMVAAELTKLQQAIGEMARLRVEMANIKTDVSQCLSITSGDTAVPDPPPLLTSSNKCF